MVSLKKSAINGIKWSLLDNIIGSGLMFLTGIILARILTPAEFGIVGLITIFIAISNSIVDSGFSSSLIRKQDLLAIEYNTVFFFSLVISIILYLIMFLLAPYISIFFEEPSLTMITRVLSFVIIINGLGIIQRAILTKHINFKTQTVISLISSIISGVISIYLALTGYGVWSIVFLQLVKQLITSVLLWLMVKWRPLLEFSNIYFKEHFTYGSKLLVSGIIDTTYNNLYYFIIGKFYSAYSLGQYTRAEQFQNIFASNLTGVIQRVSYPTLSKLQNDNIKLKLAYKKTIQLSALIVFFVMFGMIAIAKPMIYILIGDKWHDSVYYLQIICLSGMLYPLHALNLNILQVKGRSDLFLKLEIIKKCIGTFALIIGIFYGIIPLLWSGVASSLLCLYVNTFYTKKLLDYSIMEQIKDVSLFFITGIIVSTIMLSFTYIIINMYYLLVLQILTGLFISILFFELSRNEIYLELKNILFNRKIKE